VRTRIRAFELGGVAALDELDEHDDRDDDDRPVPPDRPHAGG
jgi:hypothetical protein